MFTSYSVAFQNFSKKFLSISIGYSEKICNIVKPLRISGGFLLHYIGAYCNLKTINMSKILVDLQELRKRQALPLFDKIKWTIERYIDFVEVYGVDFAYIGFSGGKDSQVLKDIIERLHKGEMEIYLQDSDENLWFEFWRSYNKGTIACGFSIEELKNMYPDAIDKLKNTLPENPYFTFYLKHIKNKLPPRSCFSDTGLEFPELRKHVKKFDYVDTVKPKLPWFETVQKLGFLIGSKKVSRAINDLRNPTDRNKASRNLYLTGIKRDGSISKTFKLALKWIKLVDAPFNVSNKCCDIYKKDPFNAYQKATGRKPISGTTAAESEMRRISYMGTGCNSFGNKPMSRPLSIWTEKDIWDYHDLMNIRFAEVYYKRKVKQLDGSYEEVEGERQTGCMFCLVGPEKQVKIRFERLKKTHPKQYIFLMEKINIKQVFEYLGITIK